MEKATASHKPTDHGTRAPVSVMQMDPEQGCKPTLSKNFICATPLTDHVKIEVNAI